MCTFTCVWSTDVKYLHGLVTASWATPFLCIAGPPQEGQLAAGLDWQCREEIPPDHTHLGHLVLAGNKNHKSYIDTCTFDTLILHIQ